MDLFTTNFVRFCYPEYWHYKLKSSAEIMAKSGSKIVIIFLPILGAIAAP